MQQKNIDRWGWLAGALFLALWPMTSAPQANDPARREAPARSGPAFELVIQAPEAVKNLLERHLELRRYRDVSDLDDAEIARLLVMAERDTRGLVGTLGHFRPDIKITRQPGNPPRIVLAVEP